MSADDATTRPLKRARLSPEADNSSCPLHPSLAPSTHSLTHLERHRELWFDDGNIILIAQQTGFRIFRGLLASQSTVFADMFTSATSQADETLDGCPVVHLTDSHFDVAHLLRVLLPKSPLLCAFHILIVEFFPLTCLIAILLPISRLPAHSTRFLLSSASHTSTTSSPCRIKGSTLYKSGPVRVTLRSSVALQSGRSCSKAPNALAP